MFRKVIFSMMICLFVFSSISYAHSGRTDSSGGHNCSQKSINKGLCSGYHYHNGGSSTGSSSSNSSSYGDKDCSDFNSYDEVITYWNTKGYSATYDPENLDGWGNNVVDDGIPCEPPGGYDLSKVNNSTYQQAAIDEELGEKAGYDKGYTDGYQNVTKNSVSGGSSAYKLAYENSYNTGYLVGQKDINEQKQNAYNNGYSLGKSQEELVVPVNFKSHTLLASSFEEGYQEGKEAYIEEQKEYYYSSGLTDGEKDIYNLPDISEQVFLDAYEKGYKEAQEALKEEYSNKGYEAAFSMIEYSNPEIDNEKLITWFKEGFESNLLVKEIQEEAFNLGKSGEDFVIPENYKQGKTIFTYYYEKGKEEYISPVPFVATAVAATGVTGYLILRRTRKKQIKNLKE
ncbi:YHYH domain-containing protein [Lysinibacillus sp. LZ02]|uniref:YHYH domain-containing protein n=1 Tax=Lysinibacillus sp. LZ02 TaxID=3420668 RepID=UPI003D36BFE6